MNKALENRKLYPIVFAWGFIPLVVHAKVYNTGYSQYDWYSEMTDVQTDFFLIYKSYMIIAIACIMAFALIYQFVLSRKHELKFEPAFYCLAAYAFLAMASFAFSEHKYYASHGAYELFEPVWVVLGYLVICYYTYCQVDRQEQVYSLVKYSGVGFAILGLIGISQFFNMDFFRTTLGKKLISPTSWWGDLDQLSFTFDPGTVYATLYNPDWVGFYTGIVMPVMVVMVFWSKKIWAKLVYAALAIAMLICLVGARAMGGIIAMISAVVIVLIILLSRNKKGVIAIGCLAITGTAALVAFLTNTAPGKGIVQTFVGTNKGYEDFGIKAIETNDKDVVFHLAEEKEIHISYTLYEDGGVTVQCLNEEGYELPTVITGEAGSTYSVEDDSYLGCAVTPMYIDDDIAIEVVIDHTTWHFSNQQDDTYYYYNPVGKYVKMSVPKDAGIFNNDGIQNRGVIWNHVIPLLPNYVFFGSGANTFAQVYPQNDYIYKAYRGMQYIYDVKAHNWYLQQWIEEGLLALLALLIFYLIYFVKCIKLYRKTCLRDPISCMGIALFIGITAYMINAIANDSNVNTAPVLWVAFGLGYAVNRIVKENMENN